jgi:hypothetical protein
MAILSVDFFSFLLVGEMLNAIPQHGLGIDDMK